MPIVLRVRDVMDSNVVFIDASRSLADAMGMMVENKSWSLIVREGGLPVGVVTERDIIRKLVSEGRMDPTRITVEQAMSSPLITIGPDAMLSEVMTLMAAKEIRRVYVVEEGRVIGKVTQTGAMHKLLDALMTLSSIPHQL